MNSDNNEFYDLNDSLKSQVNHLIKDYSKLKNIIQASESTSKRLSDNLNPLQAKLSGISSIANNLFKTVVKSATNSFMSDLSGSKSDLVGSVFGKFLGGARATGGNVSQGTPYIVGERGPELFTPSASGYIAPNNAVSTSKPINIVMNINAADAGSFQRSESQIINQISKAMRRASKNF